MQKYKYLIIGGGIAGTTAAETLRKEDPNSTVAIVSDEPHPLYSRILLSKPNFFLEKVPFDTIWMRKKDWYAEQRIDFLAGQTAIELNSADKVVGLADGTEIGYEKLLLALGCPVRKIPVPGLDKAGVNYVKTVDDARDIIANVKNAKRALVIGAGFIGFEMCDMLNLAGLEVESIIREKYFWEPVLDETAGRMLEKVMTDNGVNVRLESELSEVLGDESVEGVILKDGTKIDCQMIILAVGVNFKGEWLKEAGVEVGRGIKCDAKLATNVPDIWTAGDVAYYHDVILDEPTMCGTWINAMMQGKTAAHNMLGKEETYRHLSSYTAHGFGISIGFVGRAWCAGEEQVIGRGNPSEGSYSGILVRNNKRVVGGFMINRSQDMAPVSRMLETGLDISEIKDQISDPRIDLSSLITE